MLAKRSRSVEEGTEGESSADRKALLYLEAPSWLISLLFHLFVIIVLSLITLDLPGMHGLFGVSLTTTTDEQPELETEIVSNVPSHAAPELPEVGSSSELSEIIEELNPPQLSDLNTEYRLLDASELLADGNVTRSELSQEAGGFFAHVGFAGRDPKRRARLVRMGGGSVGSERAVWQALKWIAAHQNEDGSWSFDHRGTNCRGYCRNPGSLAEARIAGTAMALLPFLGAGQTHLGGEFSHTVGGGLDYLVSRIAYLPDGGSLHEPGGRMYSHGLASIALCEAYAMTGDSDLRKPAEQVIQYIIHAQGPRGGWRYEPGEPGDTSIIGWQLMALKSGHLARINVPFKTVEGANNFLDYVQSEYGAVYGYKSAERPSEATTAIGLLCRMYLGWHREHPALQRGVKLLSSYGPHKSNMYYNYYATQVMHHFGGLEWASWNANLRDYLVHSQSANGHESGSWYFDDEHGGSPGGRLYCTSLATMILEVYYRHMPLYGTESVEMDFTTD